MSGFSRWKLKRHLSYVAINLAVLYRTQPEKQVQRLLDGTEWSYVEWAFFYSAKRASVASKIPDAELARLVKTMNSDFRDLLLALAITTDVETRKAMFLSPDSFRKTLVDIAGLVLEHVPGEFRADDWIGSRSRAGANAFLQLHALQ